MGIIKEYQVCIILIIVLCFSGLIYYFAFNLQAQKTTPPNIIVIMADDMGRNDVSFYGSNQIPTPNIDALAYNGIILNRLYTQCSCTPSRTAFLTGNYPIRSGMQGKPIVSGENRSLPLNMATMPQLLKKLGYSTHLVGKWHLGSAYRRDTPPEKGFDTFYGYWNGLIGYFDYGVPGTLPTGFTYGLDIHDGFKSDWDVQGKYATEVFTEKSLEIIDKHNKENGLFLVVAHLAPHVGKNGIELEVPNKTVADSQFFYIKDKKRRLYAEMVRHLDISVGRIIEKLAEKNLLENSVILFFSDNGAQTVDAFANSGSNWPLRGLKSTEWEGGVRTSASIFSPFLAKQKYVSENLIHLTDFLPTFYTLAGGNIADLGKIDGINQWQTLSENTPTNRDEILLNINEVQKTSAILAIGGRYKYLKGTYNNGTHDQYFGESGRDNEVPPYNPQTVLQSQVNQILVNLTKTSLTNETILKMRSQTDLSWCRDSDQTPILDCTEGCLFDLDEDPCETTNIIEKHPEIALVLEKKLEEYNKELVPQKNQKPDPHSDPKFYNNEWCTWLDDEWCPRSSTKGI